MSKGSLSGEVARSLLANQRRSWGLALVGALVLGAVAWGAKHTVDTATKNRVSADLRAILDTSVACVRLAFDGYTRDAQFAAEDPHLRAALRSLLAVSETNRGDPVTLRAAPEQRELQERLHVLLQGGGYLAFSLTDPSGVVLATKTSALVGTRPLSADQYARLDQAGPTAILPPFPHPLTKQVLTVAAARVLEGSKTLGWVYLVASPRGELSDLLQAARAGETGETYAFDREGRLLTRSRFDDSPKEVALLQGKQAAASPDLTAKTLMVEHATTRGRGENVEGYAGYRDVPVVGSWTWLDDYDIGVGTTMEVEEAFQLREQLRRAVYVLLALLGFAIAGLVGYAYVLAVAKRRSAKAETIAQELGQYSLTKKLGEGGMGAVYEASHRMLRRPTAVKLISGDQDEQVIQRFEREVQLTSQLTHPNTIIVYDYGRTAEGVFYYAMEYLDGADLSSLVGRFGPLPGARAVHLLLQACGSLAEAHGLGLIHRDIKGANLFVCRRGGECDVLKVLDFGLVKSMSGGDEKLSQVGTIIGTPSYIAPETLTDTDAASPRSDVYALGVVAYVMLTGQEPFTGKSAMEVCIAHMTKPPPPFETFDGVDASPELRRIVLQCLEKDPTARPNSALELAALLRGCPEAAKWSHADAAAWWSSHDVVGGHASEQPVASGRTVLLVGGSRSRVE